MIKKFFFIALIVWSFPSVMAAASAEDTPKEPVRRLVRLEGSPETTPHDETVDKSTQPLQQNILPILPEELLVRIFSFLGPQDLGNIALVCKDFNRFRRQAPYELKMGREELEFIRNSTLPEILPPFICSGQVTSIKIFPRSGDVLIPLLAVLPHVPRLHTLNLSYTGIGDGGIIPLATALGNVRNLHTLNLSYTGIGKEGIIPLAAALGSVPHLHTLDVGYNNIGQEGITAVAAALGSVPNLHTLNVSHNRIGDEGVTAVAAALGTVPNLHTLNLSYTGIGKEGITVLAAALGSVPNLRSLDVSYNHLGPECCINTT